MSFFPHLTFAGFEMQGTAPNKKAFARFRDASGHPIEYELGDALARAQELAELQLVHNDGYERNSPGFNRAVATVRRGLGYTVP